MQSGYKILWTNHELKELADTYEYLEENFTEKELKKLPVEIDKLLSLIANKFNCKKSIFIPNFRISKNSKSGG